jgi:high-affinity iron transporter
MLVPFLIMLREGMEASLIVGIIASYLAQTGRRRWLPAVGAGVVLAVAICLAIGVALSVLGAEFPQRQQEMFEAAVGLIAVCILTSMVLWMKRAARSIKRELHDSVDTALGQGGSGWALVAMVFLAVGREGLESVFFLLAIFGQDVGTAPAVGAVLGLLAACGVGFAIYWGGVRLNLRRFFQWTGVLILFVAAGLLAGSVRSLHEAGLWNGLQSVVYDASATLPTASPLGTVLSALLGYQEAPTLGEVLAYLLFLVPALAIFLAVPTGAARSARTA